MYDDILNSFSNQSHQMTEEELCELEVGISKADDVLSAAHENLLHNQYVLTQESSYSIPEITSYEMLGKTVIHRHYNDEYITEMSLLEIKTLENELKQSELDILRMKSPDFQPGFMSDCVFNCFLKCYCECKFVSSGYAHTLLVQNILSGVCGEEDKERLRAVFEKEVENKQIVFIPMKFENQPLVLVVAELEKKRSLVFNPLRLFDQDRLNYIQELLAIIHVGFSDFEIVQPKRKKHPSSELPHGASIEDLHNKNFSSLMLCHYVFSFIYAGYDFVNEDVDFNVVREKVYNVIAQGCFEQPTVHTAQCRICDEAVQVGQESVHCERCNQLYHHNCLNQLQEPVIVDDRNGFVCPKLVIHYENPQLMDGDFLDGQGQFDFGESGGVMMADVNDNFDFQQLGKNDQIISYPPVE